MNRYPEIGEHGLIGDLQTAALVSTDGTIDWFCCPRFDSPSVFASLLDHDRGGHFRIGPDRGDYVSRQLYFPDTAILITRFLTPEGVGEVLDFMPVLEGMATDRHRLVRLVRVVRGTMRFRMEIQPRFDYGRKPHRLELYDPDGALFVSDDLTLTLHRADLPGRSVHEEGTSFERYGDGLRLTKTLREGEIAGVMIESEGGRPRAVPPLELVELLNDTVRFWRGWLRRSTYNGRWKEQVARSAMTLKLMTYAPTGALVAAPTAGLPEQVGGERNWDYRYTWIRDASFSVYALLGLGHTEEAAAFGGWLRDTMEQNVAAGESLHLMYRVDGSSDLDEETLDHFEGYEGSAPVRIGNGAAAQLQLDIYGEAMDSIRFVDRSGARVSDRGWSDIVYMIDWLSEHWDQPDEGIWETRGGRKGFTYSRLMEWVAFDRAIRMALDHGLPADLERWTKERDQIYRWIQ